MVILHTNQGDITLELDAENAPATVANFLQYVRDGHYDNTIFHRVIDGFMIQGGGMSPGMKEKKMRAPIANEAGNGLKNKRYTVAMARTSDPHSATAQFFINVADNDFLDHKGPSPQGWGYCVFGKVTARTGRRRQDQGRAYRQQRVPSERAEDGRGDRARRGSGIKPTLFVSDLHLSPARPALVAAFESFCAGPARAASGLYVLGDLFDQWIGDDQLREPLAARVASALRGVAASGVPVGIIVGNRDFLIGPRFAAAAGATLLPERIVVDVAGTPTLLMHGDEMCTSDVAYQRFRAFTHDRAAPTVLPRAALRRCGAASVTGCAARAALRLPSSRKPSSTSSLPPSTPRFAQPNVARIIHGHTHRPAHHRLVVDGRARERYVLADWYDRGSYLEFDAEGGRTRDDSWGSAGRGGRGSRAHAAS